MAGCGSGDDTTFPAAGDAAAGDAAAVGTPGGDASVHDSSPAPDTGSGGDAREASPGDARAPSVDATVASPDAGGAVAVFSSAPIDFGGIACAQQTTRTLIVQNTGGSLLSVQASVTGSGFSLAANTPNGLTLAPGANPGVLTVAAAFDKSSSAGVSAVGFLNLFTNDPNNAKVAIRLTAMSSGATLVFQQAGMALTDPVTFPTTKVGSSAQGSFTLINSGNAPLTFTLVPPPPPPNGTVDDFMLAGASDAGTQVTLSPVSAGAAWTGTPIFAPTSAGAKTSTWTVSPSSPICGTSLGSVVFSGTGTTGALSGYQNLTFDAVCNAAAPPPQTITLTNHSSVAVNLTGATMTGPFTHDIPAVPSPLPIAPNGGTLAIHVTPPPFPGGTVLGVSPPPIVGKLTLTTDTPGSPISINLTETGSGAILRFTEQTGFGVFSPPSIPLLQVGATHTFTVVNDGHLPALVTAFITTNASFSPNDADASAALLDGSLLASGPTPFQVSGPTNFTVAAAGNAPNSVLFSPTVAGPNLAYLAIVPDPSTPLCAPVPGVVPLTGTGIGGGPSINPTTLTFTAPCDGVSVPTAQTFTVQNTGDRDMNWALSAITGPGATGYTAASASPPAGLLEPGGLATVTVGVKQAMPRAPVGGAPSPDALAAQIVVTTDVPFDSPHVIALSEIPTGDRLSVSVAGLAFGQVSTGSQTLPQTFTVTNSASVSPGSQSANVSLSSSNPAYSVSPPAVALAPGATSAPVGVTFTPPGFGFAQATLSVVRSDAAAPLCAPLPPPIALSGTGAQGQAVLSTSQLNFGLVDCGTTAQPQGFIVSNHGNQPFDITGVTYQKPISPFAPPNPNPQLGVPTTVAIGGSVAFFVSPKPIPGPPAIVDPTDRDAFSDTLTLFTDISPGDSHPVKLVMQAHGAVIADTQLATPWNFGIVPFGSASTITSTVRTAGNAPVSVTLAGASQPTITQPTIFGLASDPTIIAANDVTSVVGRFAPPSAGGSWTDQGMLLLSAPVVCGTIPSAWQPSTTPGQWQSAPFPISGSSPSSSSPPVTASGDLAFPATECGSAPPAPRNVLLTNNSNQDYAFSASLRFGTHYTLATGGVADAGTGTLAANGGAMSLSITPQAVIPGPGVLSGSAPYADSLVINVGNPPSSPIATFNLPISWSLNGAVLSLPAGAGDHVFNGVRYYVADSTSGLVIPMNNTGNETAFVDFAIPPAANFVVSPTPPIAVLPGIGALPRLSSTTGAASCTSSVSGPNSSVIFAYPPGSPVCQPFQSATVRILSCTGTTN